MPDSAARNPLLRFGNGLVGQPDNGELALPLGDLHLHVDGARLKAEKCGSGDVRDHMPSQERGLARRLAASA